MKSIVLMALILFAFLSPTLASYNGADGLSVNVGYTDVINEDTPTAAEELNTYNSFDDVYAIQNPSSLDQKVLPYFKERRLTHFEIAPRKVYYVTSKVPLNRYVAKASAYLPRRC